MVSPRRTGARPSLSLALESLDLTSVNWDVCAQTRTPRGKLGWAESWAAEDGAGRQELQVALPLLPRDRRVLGSAAGTKETSVFLHREPGAYSRGHHEPLTSTSTLVAFKPAHMLGHLLGETRVDHPTPMLIPGTGLPVGAPCP